MVMCILKNGERFQASPEPIIGTAEKPLNLIGLINIEWVSCVFE